MDFTNFKLSRIAGLMLCCLAGLFMISCEDEDGIFKGKLVMNFGDGNNGDGDLYREIPAEGGSITLLTPDESANLWNLQPNFLINRPLEWFVTNRVENTNLVFNRFFRTGLNNIITEAYDGTEFYIFVDGYKYPDKNFSNGVWSIPLLRDIRKFHYGEADWLKVRFFTDDKIEVEAAANDTGEDRYISFIYDSSNPSGGTWQYGSIEVKQPALK